MKMFKCKIELKGDYKLEVYDDWFEVNDSKGNIVYHENSNGYWYKREYDSKGNIVYLEDSTGEVIDNRVKEKITIELTQEQLNKIKESGVLNE